MAVEAKFFHGKYHLQKMAVPYITSRYTVLYMKTMPASFSDDPTKLYDPPTIIKEYYQAVVKNERVYYFFQRREIRNEQKQGE